MLLVCMNKERIYMVVVSIGYYIYVMGGYFFWKVLDFVERYEWLGNKWCKFLFLFVDRMGVSVINLESKFIVIGGYSKILGRLLFVEVYDFLIDSWIFIVLMRVKRSYFGVVLLGEIVYVIGGFGGEYSNLDDWLMLVESLEF